MQIDFSYRLDKRTRIWTWVIALMIVMLGGFFILYSQSGYFPIWFTFFLLTVLLLCILSIPRKIRVTDQAVQIQCVVEMTRIELENIAAIRKMDRSEMKFSMPLLGSYGFFGYYGWYYNFEEFSLFKVYTSQWKNFVRIDDIYETTYVVSCEYADQFIAAVLAAQEKLRIEMEPAANQTGHGTK